MCRRCCFIEFLTRKTHKTRPIYIKFIFIETTDANILFESSTSLHILYIDTNGEYIM